MRRILTLLLLVAAPLAFGQRRRAAAPPLFPPCSVVEGTPGVTFSRNEGGTLARMAQPLRGTAYTYGLAALDVPHTLLSFHGPTLSISRDDGCHWTPLGDYVADFPPSITAAPGGRAYIWSDNRQFLLRYDDNGVVALKPPGAIVGLGVDPQNGLRIRIGTNDGSIADSRDGGATWTGAGFPPAMMASFYRVAFDPNDLDHVVAGAMVEGAFVSRNGGQSWTRATGFASGRVNAFNFAISPVDPNTVWLAAIDLSDESRHIYLSRDGGASYTAVVDPSADVTIINQPVMVAHPTDANVMYFVFGTFFQGYGTDIYRFDAATRRLTTTHNPYNDINAIAFSRDHPEVMYLGLEVENVF